MFKAKFDESMIHGDVSPGFEEVREEFLRNFRERGDLGAACAIYHKGEKVVDLWGGYRNHKTKAPWEEDTLVLVFSTTKGLASMAVAVAHSRGLFKYDDRVAKYWPEFAQNGKENITIRQLLSHQAGLCAIDEPLDLETLADPDKLADILARQKPAWEPGMKQGYHCWSLGFYEGELIRRVDPKHRSLGQFFQDEVAKPLGLEFYIGLPPEIPDSQIAVLKTYHVFQMLFNLDKMPASLVKGYFNTKSMTSRAMSNPKICCTHSNFNKRELQSVEIPAGNGIGRVRSIAKAYSEFATGGHELDIKKETLDALSLPAVPPIKGLYDEVLTINVAWSLGFMKPSPYFNFGGSDKSFGIAGAGGSFGFADPDAGIGYAYAMTKMGFYPWDDPRDKALRDALYRCL